MIWQPIWLPEQEHHSRIGIPALAFLPCQDLLSVFLCIVLLASAAVPAQAQTGTSTNDAEFTLSGTVVNSVTGEGIARALVQIQGTYQRSAFTDGDGRFQFEGLKAGYATITAQKPGYFEEQGQRTITTYASGYSADSGPLALKLTPQSAVYGRLTDSAGQPLEQVPVRLTGSVIREGRKHLETRGYVQSDEDGRFRIANLMPGTYYLAAGPAREAAHLLPGGDQPRTGYAAVYYPGVPDMASAAPMQIAAGQQVEADLTLSVAPVFHVSGTVAGYPPEQGFNLQFFTQSGDWIPFPVPYNPHMGTFEAKQVPAGSYLVKASAQIGSQQLRADLRLNVASNLDDVRLVLGPAINIPVNVRTESRAASDRNASASQRPPPLSVHLSSLEPSVPDAYSNVSRSEGGRYSIDLLNVEPGKYAVDFLPQPPWYVRSAQFGQTNVLTDNLAVTAGQSSPMEVVLRDDGAELNGTVKAADGTETPATVIAVQQPASNASVKIAPANLGVGFHLWGLAPGNYLLFAFDHIDDLEYSDPEALQHYASQAAHVTLSAGQESTAALTLIHAGGGQ
ncbi:MAG: carboxypeptidase-like regulatory domain-containing protein [Acidobacteriota bacterium]|nr:carboxypeptidase-like regulatory domain-containing protein [Acidobacteriota bacterium]